MRRLVISLSAAVLLLLASALPADASRVTPSIHARMQIAWQTMHWYGGQHHDQFTCLNNLIWRESGWNPLARNPHSGAYGIPQSLPAEKLATEGPDWRTSTRTQMRWMLKYVQKRYGTPCGAWAHSQEHHWY